MSEFVYFEADDDNDVILEDDRLSEVETVSDAEFIDNTEYNVGVLRIITHLKMFLESMMMQLETPLLVLTFHESQIIIVLMIISAMK